MGCKVSQISVRVGALLAASLGLHALPASAGTNCKSQYMWGQGWALSESKAKERARVNWRARVTLKYGAPYRNWDYANNRQYGCNNKAGGRSCTAYGYPCLWP